MGPRPPREQAVERAAGRRQERGRAPDRRRDRRPRRGTAPRPRWRSSARPRRSGPGPRAASRPARRATVAATATPPSVRAATSAVDRSPSRRSRSWTPSSVVARRSSASAWSAARGRPARPGRAARAAPPGRAARAAGRGRASARRRGARRAACRRRTCRPRRSRTAGCSRTASPAASRRRGPRSRGGRRRARISRSAGRSKTSDRHSRYVSTRIGKLAVARGDGQQVGRALALLPERRPRPGPAARQQQRPRRVLAEPAREQRRRRELPDDQVLDLVGLGEEQRLDAVERRVALGQPDRDAVVRPDRLDLEPEPLADPRLERQRPRRVDAAAERRQQAQPPVAELVAEALDDDALVGRQGAGRLALVLEVREQVLGRQLVEVVRLAQARRRGRATALAAREVRLELADERARSPARARSAARPRRPSRTAACRARRARG